MQSFLGNQRLINSNSESPLCLCDAKGNRGGFLVVDVREWHSCAVSFSGAGRVRATARVASWSNPRSAWRGREGGAASNSARVSLLHTFSDRAVRCPGPPQRSRRRGGVDGELLQSVSPGLAPAPYLNNVRQAFDKDTSCHVGFCRITDGPTGRGHFRCWFDPRTAQEKHHGGH